MSEATPEPAEPKPVEPEPEAAKAPDEPPVLLDDDYLPDAIELSQRPRVQGEPA